MKKVRKMLHEWPHPLVIKLKCESKVKVYLSKSTEILHVILCNVCYVDFQRVQ